jgi:competence protein ComEC
MPVWRRRNRTVAHAEPPPSASFRPAPPLRRPLLGLLGGVVAGILTGLLAGPDPRWPLAAAWLCVLAMTLLHRRPRPALTLLWAAVFFTAWTHAAVQTQRPSPRELGHRMQRPRERLALRGRVADDPVRETGPAGEPARWRLTLHVQQVDRTGVFEPAHGTVDVHWPQTGPDEPAYGDRWEFSGVVQRFERDDPQWAYLPPYRLRANGPGAIKLASGRGLDPRRLAYRLRHAAAGRLELGLESQPEQAAVLKALLLGYRHELPDAHHELFARTGTLHIFAISGLHVGIVAGLILVVVQACGVPRPRWILWVGPLLILYTIATGMRPSALRACTMALAFGSAYLFDRRPDAPSAWALAALLILAAAPAQLAAPGFIFSFVIVAGLLRLYPVFARPVRQWTAPDLYLPSGPRSGESLPRGLLRAALGLAVVSLAAWLVSAPLTAYYFNRFTPVGLIANLFVIPAAFLLVLSGLLTLTVGAFSDTLAEVFNHGAGAVLSGLLRLIEILDALPGGHRHVRAPSLPAIGLWYAFLFGGLLWPTARQRRRGYGLLALLALATLLAVGPPPQDRILVLTPGDGHAVLIRSGGENTLYDAGPAYRADRLLATLRAHGVNRLDRLILSHPVAGHAGGAEAVLRAMPVRELWCTAFPSRSPVHDRALALAAERDIPVRVRAAGDRGTWPAGLAWEVLHPHDPARHGRAADASLVLRLSRGTRAVLLTGGAGGLVEQAILDAGRDPAATVLVIGNQGRPDTARPDWLDAVQPAAIILPASPYNRRGLPDPSVLDRLATRPETVLRHSGDGDGIEIQLTSRIRRRRQHDTWKIRPGRNR